MISNRTHVVENFEWPEETFGKLVGSPLSNKLLVVMANAKEDPAIVKKKGMIYHCFVCSSGHALTSAYQSYLQLI